jgi:hypothetical protein
VVILYATFLSLGWHLAIAAALTKMAAAAKRFDVNSVKPGDLALVAAVATTDE